MSAVCQNSAEEESSSQLQSSAQEKLYCCVMVGRVVSSHICNELHQIFFGTSFPLNKFVCLEYTLQQVLLTSSWSCAPCPGEIQRWKLQNCRERAVVFSRTVQIHVVLLMTAQSCYPALVYVQLMGTSRDKNRVYSLQFHAWFEL